MMLDSRRFPKPPWEDCPDHSSATLSASNSSTPKRPPAQSQVIYYLTKLCCDKRIKRMEENVMFDV